MTVLTRSIARLLLLPILLVSVAILLRGYDYPGDGFSAGLVAALGLVLQYIAWGHRNVERALPVRHAWRLGFAGLATALTAGFLPAFAGHFPLAHQPGAGSGVASWGHLKAHTGLLFDIGIYLLVLGFTVAIVDRLARKEDQP